MARRTDYFNDPDAPTPTALVPGGSALITDDQGRILMQRRADSGNWSLPGGVMEIGETMGQAVVREVKEDSFSLPPP
jgi:ADP-ribose pyrophosphatase YjhB (NUDIX family)